jgi:hypothetical protein
MSPRNSWSGCSDLESDMTRDGLHKALIALAECIGRSSESEVQDLLEGLRDLRIGARQTTIRSTKHRPSIQTIDVASLRQRLDGCETRSEGNEVLQLAGVHKADLVELARLLDVPVTKSDNIERLREKVVEATVGYRLASKAIRGG